jgi:hypothetical protein
MFNYITRALKPALKQIVMAKSKTWCERILNAASKENTIDNRTLRVRFRIPKTEMSQEEFNTSIGRSMIHLAANKMLKRVDRGVYTITKKGQKAISA